MEEKGLTILLDRANTGKSTYILQQIAAERLRGRQILLVPEHASHQAEREICAVCGDCASRHVSVASFRWLAADILSRFGGVGGTALDQGGKILTMYRAIQKNAEILKVYSRPSQRAAFLEQLLSLHEEMKAYCISNETLLNHGDAEDLSRPLCEKLEDLGHIFGVYDALLTEGEDRRDMTDRLLDALAQDGKETAKTYFSGTRVYIDGFLYFNQREKEILRYMIRYADSVTVALMGEEGGTEGAFSMAKREAQALARLAEEEHVRRWIVPSPLREETQGLPALVHLEQHYFGKIVPFADEAAGIRLLCAQTAYDEVEQTAAEIRKLVVAGKCRYRDIAVAARNMELYEATIENVFERYDLPVFLNRSRDILETPVIALVLGALDTVANDWEYEYLFRYLKTGMAGLAGEACDELENYVLKWDIRGAMWRSEEAWTAHPDGYDARESEESAALLARLNESRAAVRAPLLTLSAEINRKHPPREKLAALYQFLLDIHLPDQLREKTEQFHARGEKKLAEEYAQVWQLLCDVMDQFMLILGDVDEEMEAREFVHLLKLVLTQYDIGTIPVALDQISVAEITRNERRRYRYVFLLGANDHIMPAAGSGGGILTDGDRSELLPYLRMAPFGVAQLDMEMIYLYKALSQATDGLCVSWPCTDVSGAELRPAFIVGRMRHLFPALAVEETTPERLLAAPVPALETAGRAQGGSLWTYFEDAGAWQETLHTMERAGALQRGHLSTETVQALYGTQIRMSASRMDRVNSCHFAFFMQYGLKVKERRKAGLDAPEIGTFLHYLLEHTAREAKQRGGFQNVTEEELHGWIEFYIARFVRENLGGMAGKSARFRYLFGRLKKTAFAIVDNVAAELAQSDFIPIAFELEFGSHGAVPAVKMEAGGTHLRVGGKVDRVDGWVKDGAMYLRVVDYKTGKKKFDLSELLHGVGAQMLLYLFALERQGMDALGAGVERIIPAGVEYLPARDAILSMERTATTEQIAAAMEKELRRSGLFLYNADVLEAMEHGSTTQPHFLPLTVKKDGTITDGVATAAQIGKLSRYVDHLLRQIAVEMGRGNIDADPSYQGESKNACLYCPYASACHFEEGRGSDRRKYIASVKAQEFWDAVDRTSTEEA